MRDAFEAAGIGGFDVFDFAREGQSPTARRSSSRSRWLSPAIQHSPDVRFAVCQHHFPENFWDPAFQAHANGARAVPGVVMVADNPTDHHIS